MQSAERIRQELKYGVKTKINIMFLIGNKYSLHYFCSHFEHSHLILHYFT